MTRAAAARNGREGLREENVPTLVWMMNPAPRAITRPHSKSATVTARIASLTVFLPLSERIGISARGWHRTCRPRQSACEPVNRRLGTPHILRLRPAGAEKERHGMTRSYGL